jgi:two-component system response regulator FixJ
MSGKAPNADLPYVVLIAAHDSGLRLALEFLLRAEGYRILGVDSGEALLKVRLPERNACLVVDQDLPCLSGLAAIAELRRRGVNLPIMLLTGDLQRMLRMIGETPGVHLIDKPLLGEALLTPIAAALIGPTPPRRP